MALAAPLLACGSSERVQTAPRVTSIGPIVAATPPAGVTGPVVAIYFGLADAEAGPTDITFEVSRGSGAFQPVGSGVPLIDGGLPPSTGGSIVLGGDGLLGLNAPAGGVTHRILWSPSAEIAAAPMDSLRVRLTPSEPPITPPPKYLDGITGAPVVSTSFTLAGLPAENR